MPLVYLSVQYEAETEMLSIINTPAIPFPLGEKLMKKDPLAASLKMSAPIS